MYGSLKFDGPHCDCMWLIAIDLYELLQGGGNPAAGDRQEEKEKESEKTGVLQLIQQREFLGCGQGRNGYNGVAFRRRLLESQTSHPQVLYPSCSIVGALLNFAGKWGWSLKGRACAAGCHLLWNQARNFEVLCDVLDMWLSSAKRGFCCNGSWLEQQI